MIKIDCNSYAQSIKELVKNSEKSGKLAILYAGNNKASASYMKGKLKDAEECGIEVEQINCINYYDMLYRISTCNHNESIGGLIVQLPLPEGYNSKLLLGNILSEKDVDGFKADSKFLPCTPEGIMYVLNKNIDNFKGKRVTLIGKGKLVGRPLINLLLDKGVTLTVASSNTINLEQYFDTDILISAVGKHGLVDLSKVNAEIVIDAGIDYVDGHICGDCYNYNFDGKGMKVTTTPGGIGLMTRAMLMKHMIK